MRHGFDARGERLKTLYLGRMPESGKVTLKAQLASEVAHIRQLRPDVRIVLSTGPSCQTEVIDFWHACEHLRTASDHAVVSDSRGTARFCVNPCGVDKVITFVTPDRAEIEQLAFFRCATPEGRGRRHRLSVVRPTRPWSQRMKAACADRQRAGCADLPRIKSDRAWKAIIGATDTPANDNINPCAVIAIAA